MDYLIYVYFSEGCFPHMRRPVDTVFTKNFFCVVFSSNFETGIVPTVGLYRNIHFDMSVVSSDDEGMLLSFSLISVSVICREI